MSAPSNPIAAAFAATPWWMLAIRNFDAIEVHPCCVVGVAGGIEIVETRARRRSVLVGLWPLRDRGPRMFRRFPDRGRGGRICRQAAARLSASCRRGAAMTAL